MKFQLKLICGLSLFCAGSIVWFALTPSVAPVAMASAPTHRTPGKPAVIEVDYDRNTASPAASNEETANTDDEELGSVSQWHARFSALVNECGNRQEASARLISELDQKYYKWVRSKVAALAGLPPLDRYDPLAQMETRIRNVAEAILGHLEIAGGRHFHVLANSLEALSAEVRYAEMEGSHDQRVAMLRLDQERESRFGKLVAANGLGRETEMQVGSEIEPWYESQLRGILGADDPDETN
jgi:hypothetical protein